MLLAISFGVTDCSSTAVAKVATILFAKIFTADSNFFAD